MAKVYFDVSGIAGLGDWRTHGETIAARIRALGTQRMLFGSDGTPDLLRPRDAWAAFMERPLTTDAFATSANNVAPYMR